MITGQARVLGDSFLAPLHRHFINLMCLDSGPEALKAHGGKPAVYNFSAFVVEVDGRWLAISAGHIFRDLKRAVLNGSRLSDWQIDDSILSHSPQPAYRVSLDLDSDVHSLYDEVEGMDYACFELDFLTRTALMKEGIRAIPPKVWDAEDVPDFSLWLIVGTPLTLATLTLGEPLIKHHATIQLERLTDVPSGLRNTEFTRLFAKIHFESVMDAEPGFDIGGMSGGPVFGLRPFTERKPYEYRLIGIQSAWNNKDCVAACAAAPYIRAIARAADGRDGVGLPAS